MTSSAVSLHRKAGSHKLAATLTTLSSRRDPLRHFVPVPAVLTFVRVPSFQMLLGSDNTSLSVCWDLMIGYTSHTGHTSHGSTAPVPLGVHGTSDSWGPCIHIYVYVDVSLHIKVNQKSIVCVHIFFGSHR